MTGIRSPQRLGLLIGVVVAAVAAMLGSTWRGDSGGERRGIVVDDGVLEYMRDEGSGAMYFELVDAEPRGAAVDAMQAAGEALYSEPHPDEPDGGLPSYVTDAEAIPGESGAFFWADISDMEEEPAVLRQVLDTVVRELEASELESGRLRVPQFPDR